MKAIIIAGGKGERLKPLTANLPKAMIKVAGKPILEHIIIHFKRHKISEFIISLCFLPDKITSYFGDGSKFGVKINYIFEDEKNPLGTAGAILKAKKFVRDAFIVAYADILRKLDIAKMIKSHKDKKAFATILAYHNKKADPKSIIRFDNNKKIFQFIERPKPGDVGREKIWSNASLYIFEPEIFDYIPAGLNSDFAKDIFPKVIKKGKNIFAFKADGYFVDIGSPEKLAYARKTYYLVKI